MHRTMLLLGALVAALLSMQPGSAGVSEKVAGGYVTVPAAHIDAAEVARYIYAGCPQTDAYTIGLTASVVPVERFAGQTLRLHLDGVAGVIPIPADDFFSPYREVLINGYSSCNLASPKSFRETATWRAGSDASLGEGDAVFVVPAGMRFVTVNMTTRSDSVYRGQYFSVFREYAAG